MRVGILCWREGNPKDRTLVRPVPKFQPSSGAGDYPMFWRVGTMLSSERKFEGSV